MNGPLSEVEIVAHRLAPVLMGATEYADGAVWASLSAYNQNRAIKAAKAAIAAFEDEPR